MDSTIVFSIALAAAGVIMPLSISVGIYLLKQALKQSAEEMREEVREARSEISDAVKSLSENMRTEAAVDAERREMEAERRKMDEAWRQVNQEHVSQSAAEHEALMNGMETISNQNEKQTQVLQELVFHAKNKKGA